MSSYIQAPSAGGQSPGSDISKQKWVEAIQDLLDVGATDQAKRIDKEHNVGFFSKTTKALRYLDKFITCNLQMLKLKEQVLRLADPTITDPVLILGETGTGKELLAHALHADKIGNFVEINCAGLPEHLIESELFGYVDGAYTGAKKGGQAGLIELAGQDSKGNQARGSLFLDEIGELPLQVQAKLLRVLNDGRVRKVGGSTYEWVDFRLICATHQSIDAPDYKHFRRDLYHRISLIELRTLPLIQRKEDIKPIIESLQIGAHDKLFDRYIKDNTLGGNVRDLQKLVRRLQLELL
jgi:transcriptional regulator with PAS, ATPase and Fis domain